MCRCTSHPNARAVPKQTSDVSSGMSERSGVGMPNQSTQSARKVQRQGQRHREQHQPRSRSRTAPRITVSAKPQMDPPRSSLTTIVRQGTTIA